jgi:hypothetical protein
MFSKSKPMAAASTLLVSAPKMRHLPSLRACHRRAWCSYDHWHGNSHRRPAQSLFQWNPALEAGLITRLMTWTPCLSGRITDNSPAIVFALPTRPKTARNGRFCSKWPTPGRLLPFRLLCLLSTPQIGTCLIPRRSKAAGSGAVLTAPFLCLPLHRRRVGILRLDPVRRAASAIRRAKPL